MTNPETISQFADTIVDEYSVTKKKIRVDFFKYFQSEDVDRKTINEYSSNHIHLVTDILEEVDGALGGDKILSEAYSHFNNLELKEFKMLLDRFISDVEKYKDSKKIIRRKKKKTPDQLVKGLHLQQTSVIIQGKKYDPVSTEKIIGAKSIFLINTTTYDLLYLTGKSLSCKGAKILDYNEKFSGLKKLKKLIQSLDEVTQCCSPTCQVFFDSLPNKKRKIPKTVSPNYLLIKVLQ
tara:strand:+ start:840 stop:1547 length:708 start_codon:yes stop_codon:yes gene_type:complete